MINNPQNDPQMTHRWPTDDLHNKHHKPHNCSLTGPFFLLLFEVCEFIVWQGTTVVISIWGVEGRGGGSEGEGIKSTHSLSVGSFPLTLATIMVVLALQTPSLLQYCTSQQQHNKTTCNLEMQNREDSVYRTRHYIAEMYITKRNKHLLLMESAFPCQILLYRGISYLETIKLRKATIVVWSG